VEGVPTQDSIVKRNKMNFLTTDEAVAKLLQEQGHEFTDEAVISGITGGLVAECPFIQCHLTCLLCPASAFFPDASTSLELVKILMRLIPGMQDVDTSPLQDKASFLEDKVKKIMKLSSSGGGPPAGMFG
jgi:predicted ATP-grasp superfamily ATP-dependent carboligase